MPMTNRKRQRAAAGSCKLGLSQLPERAESQISPIREFSRATHELRRFSDRGAGGRKRERRLLSRLCTFPTCIFCRTCLPLEPTAETTNQSAGHCAISARAFDD